MNTADVIGTLSAAVDQAANTVTDLSRAPEAFADAATESADAGEWIVRPRIERGDCEIECLMSMTCGDARTLNSVRSIRTIGEWSQGVTTTGGATRLGTVLTVAQRATCGECWAYPNEPCNRADGGTHVARLGRAIRRGLISGTDLVTILQSLGEPFTSATVVPWPRSEHAR